MPPAFKAVSSSRGVAGFTLLEVVVAISIAALVLGVSAPAMQRLYRSTQYHGAVNDVLTLLSSARYSAIKQGGDEDVLINPRTREITVNEKVEKLPDSIQVDVVGASELNRDGAGVIRFYADGSSSGGSVELKDGSGRAVQLQVDWMLGRVSQCNEDCDTGL